MLIKEDKIEEIRKQKSRNEAEDRDNSHRLSMERIRKCKKFLGPGHCSHGVKLFEDVKNVQKKR